VPLSQAYAISKAWARLDDNGTTYCTLYNLVEGETETSCYDGFDESIFFLCSHDAFCVHLQAAGWWMLRAIRCTPTNGSVWSTRPPTAPSTDEICRSLRWFNTLTKTTEQSWIALYTPSEVFQLLVFLRSLSYTVL